MEADRFGVALSIDVKGVPAKEASGNGRFTISIDRPLVRKWQNEKGGNSDLT